MDDWYCKIQGPSLLSSGNSRAKKMNFKTDVWAIPFSGLENTIVILFCQFELGLKGQTPERNRSRGDRLCVMYCNAHTPGCIRVAFVLT
jgi:hypothetical protein